MRRVNRLVAALFAFVASLVLVSAIAVAQPASQGTPASPPMGMSGDQGSMMGGGMMGDMGGMRMGGGGGVGGMGCMGGMGMMQMMQKDPKLMGRMMELQGEMMRLMSDAMIQRGKELQKSK
jgi:hypothetical protein